MLPALTTAAALGRQDISPCHQEIMQLPQSASQPPIYTSEYAVRNVYSQPHPCHAYQIPHNQERQETYIPHTQMSYVQSPSPPVPRESTSIPMRSFSSTQGFWTNQAVDFGVPDDKLLTSSLETKIRHGFIRKVYGLLSVMLLITFGLALMFNLWTEAGLWLLFNWWLMITAMTISFMAIIVLVCIPSVARTYPTNFITLFVISFSFGILLGYGCAVVSTYAFAMAAGITALVCLALTLFAFQTKWDFTGCHVFVFVSLIVLITFGIILIFIHDRIAHIVYASLGALCFSFYLVIDTQRIAGGKHKYQFSIDDYAFAALSLFLDVINLFMYILTILIAAH